MSINLRTERLLLRPRSRSDYDACLAMDRDPDVTRYVAGPWQDPALHERFLKERIETSFEDGLGYWSIFPKSDPSLFLGWILLIPYDGTGPDIEIGWRLNRLAWGKGYATEAAVPFIRHAFETLKLDRIVADINPDNLASMRVSEKIGMKFVGDIQHKGMPLKSYVMTADDYKRSTMEPV